MKIIEIDSRIADADRILTQFERQNVPTNIAKEMLPALLSPSKAVRGSAGQWLTDHASVGLGLASDEHEARELRQIQLAAREYVAAQRTADPHSVPNVPGLADRFHASEESLSARADEATCNPGGGYPGSARNSEVISAADADVDDEALAAQWQWGR